MTPPIDVMHIDPNDDQSHSSFVPVAPFEIVIFGGTGDLARRKLLPALYHRFCDGQIPENSKIIGVSRSKYTREEFARKALEAYSIYGSADTYDEKCWNDFGKLADYYAIDVGGEDADWSGLQAALSTDPDIVRVFYLAVPPSIYADICKGLKAAGLVTSNSRVVMEKPIGTNFESAVEGEPDLGHTASMSLLTKILTAGARLFGPPPRVDRDGQPGQIEPAGVTAALIALGAKMAKSDGVVTVDEIDAFKRVFQASRENDAAIGRFFDLARQTTLGFERYASIVAKKFRAQPAALEDVLDGLFHIALADGVVTDDEHDFLRRVGEIFGFSDHEFKRIQIAHIGRASDDPYLILGIEETVTDSELKRAYRRMAAANHPDRIMARGLPQELIALANHKMAMVNKAYDEIKRQRKSILPKLHGPNP